MDGNGTVKLGDFGVSACMFDTGDRQRPRKTFTGTPCWCDFHHFVVPVVFVRVSFVLLSLNCTYSRLSQYCALQLANFFNVWST